MALGAPLLWVVSLLPNVFGVLSVIVTCGCAVVYQRRGPERVDWWAQNKAFIERCVMDSAQEPVPMREQRESEKEAVRVELFDDEIEDISIFDPLTGEVMQRVPRYTVFPKTHYVTRRDRILNVIDT